MKRGSNTSELLVHGLMSPFSCCCLLFVMLCLLLEVVHWSIPAGYRFSTRIVSHVSLFLPAASLSGTGAPSIVCIVEAALLLIGFLSWRFVIVVAAPCGGRVDGACNGG